MKRLALLAVCAATQLVLAGPAAAATLLGSDHVGSLTAIDTTTGAGTLIGQETRFPLATEIEYDAVNGILYGDEINGYTALHTIDAATGLSTGSVGHACCAFNGMEFVGTTLYVTNITGPQGLSTLETVDPATGTSTVIGPTGFGPISGLAYDVGSGTMYGVTAGGAPALLVTVNLATGAAAPVAPLMDVAGAPLLRVGSIEFGPDGVLYGAMAQNGTPNAGWLFSIDTTTGLSTFIGATGLAGITGLTNAESEAENGTARFQVVKTFSDGNTAEVEVTLTCNSGLPLTQSFTIAGDDPDGVTFVVTELPDGGADCEVTETGAPDGYVTVMNNGAGCSWTGVMRGYRACRIENRAGPAEYTVTKVWNLGENWYEEDDYFVDVTVTCDSNILAVNGSSYAGGTFWTGVLGNADSAVLTVDATLGATECSATEHFSQSGVEDQASDDCTEAPLPVGGRATCTFTNTVFYEGIPTMSQLGLAVLALLMLGVGFIGLRRIV